MTDDELWRGRVMKTRSLWIIGCLAPLVMGACASRQAAPTQVGGKVTPQMRSGSPELRAYKVVDWTAPDDHTLIVNAADRSLYQARFKGQCTGLRLVDTIAFIVPTASQVDQYEGVVLPDGTRCAFKSLDRLVPGTAPSKDNAD
jgi:hypothetical protein